MKNADLLKKIKCKQNDSLIKVMRIIDQAGLGIALIFDEKRNFIGTVSDTDIRNSILKGANPDDSINKIVNKKPVILENKETKNEKLIQSKIKYLYQKKIEPKIIPILNGKNEVADLIFVTSKKRYRSLKDGVKQKDIVKKVLVLGGAGYLGSILCRKLLDKGYSVRVMDICLFGEESIKDLKKNKNFEFMKADIRDISSVTKALTDIDAVILLAAIVGDPASKAYPVETIETNYLATKMVTEACKYHQINRFIFASTCSVYGTGKNSLDEKSELSPISLYARSKIESEQAILELTDKNFAPTIMRMGTLYGLSHRMRFDLVVNIFALHAATKGKIKIFGGEQWRPLLNVEDAADAYIACLETPICNIRGEIFNVGSDEQNYQIRTLGSLVKKVLPGTTIEQVNKEIFDGKPDARDYKVSFEKIKRILEFSASRTVEQSIKEIADAVISGEIKNPSDSKYYNCI